MYNRVHIDQNQRLMLKPYIPGVDSWIGDKRFIIVIILKHYQSIKSLDR